MNLVLVLLTLTFTEISSLCSTIQYVKQPPTRLQCDPYNTTVEPPVWRLALECEAMQLVDDDLKFELRWFHNTTSGEVIELESMSATFVSTKRSIYGSEGEFINNEPMIGQYWCQAFVTSTISHTPLTRSNILQLDGPQAYQDLLRCNSIQSIIEEKCAEFSNEEDTMAPTTITMLTTNISTATTLPDEEIRLTTSTVTITRIPTIATTSTETPTDISIINEIPHQSSISDSMASHIQSTTTTKYTSLISIPSLIAIPKPSSKTITVVSTTAVSPTLVTQTEKYISTVSMWLIMGVSLVVGVILLVILIVILLVIYRRSKHNGRVQTESTNNPFSNPLYISTEPEGINPVPIHANKRPPRISTVTCPELYEPEYIDPIQIHTDKRPSRVSFLELYEPEYIDPIQIHAKKRPSATCPELYHNVDENSLYDHIHCYQSLTTITADYMTIYNSRNTINNNENVYDDYETIDD